MHQASSGSCCADAAQYDQCLPIFLGAVRNSTRALSLLRLSKKLRIQSGQDGTEIFLYERKPL